MGSTPAPGDDPLTAALEEISSRAGIFAKLGPPRTARGFGAEIINAACASASSVPVLLAAVEATLKLAAAWDAPVPQYDDRMNVRQDCAVKLYETITREITGKAGSDEQ